MSFSQRSWIAAALLPDEVADKVVYVSSTLVLYNSTAGPFGGIGGSAMTHFQMTRIDLPDCTLVFADDRLLGWLEDWDAIQEFIDTWNDLHFRGPMATPGTPRPRTAAKDRIAHMLQPADTCPIPLRERTIP